MSELDGRRPSLALRQRTSGLRRTLARSNNEDAPFMRGFSPPPTHVSRSVAALEAELGARLFQRNTRRMALTDAGERYRERVAPLVEELERAREEALSAGTAVNGTLKLRAEAE
jgi:hypothetical protein